MKAFKIVVLILTLLYTLAVVGSDLDFVYKYWREMSLFNLVVTASVFILVFLCTAYHLISFKYYKNVQPKKDINTLYWIGAIGCSLFTFYTSGLQFVKAFQGESQTEALIVMSLVFVYGVLNLVEVIYLRKRIKKLVKTSLDTEIDTIGDSH